jgi:uncharacterized membrane protein YdjX (TVP38/TMEM64 family)
MANRYSRQHEEVGMKQRSWLIKSLLFIVVVGGLLWFNYKVLHLNPEGIRAWILSFGWAAPVLFILLYTVRPLILFPASILSLTGGLAFGPVWGTFYTIVGATMGAVLSFWLARFVGKKFDRIRLNEKWGKLEKQLAFKGKSGFFIVTALPTGTPIYLLAKGV